MMPRVPVLLRRALLLVALLAAGWALVVVFTGGVALKGWWLSSREPVRPLIAAAAAVLWYIVRYGNRWQEDSAALSRLVSPRAIALAASLAALVVGLRWGTFVAGGQDSSGYISQAEMWLHGEITRPAPAWVEHAQWPDATTSASPLGYIGNERTHRIVPIYPPGLSLTMAAFQAIGGRPAVYYVVPVFGIIAVWAAYLLGACLAGRWVGAATSVLLVSSPTFLWQLVQPMSDVPATALWTLAIVAACQPALAGALGAGAAASFAILIRPNLAPLAGVVVLLVLTGPGVRRARVRRAIGCALATVPAAVVIALLDWQWYGSPLLSGYGSLDELYSIDRVWPNLKNYGTWFLEAETPFALLALAAPSLYRGDAAVPFARVALITVVFPLGLLALYLPYFVFHVWWFLRFLLPAYPPLLAGAVAVMALGLRPSLGRARLVGPLVLYVALTLALHGVEYAQRHRLPDLRAFERRYVQAADYAQQLPRPSVLVAMQHSGSLRYYTTHDVLRWAVVGAGPFDAAVGYLRGLGYHVYLLVDRSETDALQRHLGGTATLKSLEGLTPVRLPGGVIVYPLGGTEAPPEVPFNMRD